VKPPSLRPARSAAAAGRRLLAPLGAAAIALPAGAQIYADFDTGEGPFTIVMDNFIYSPQAVANFIRLAEGSVPWLDPVSGELQFDTPFYDGLTFHRAVDGEEIATGSPGGTGDDGPGWRFQDDLRLGLGGTYSVYMDNRNENGDFQVNRNGSRLFIGIPVQPASLGDKLTRLGYVSTDTVVPLANGRMTVSNISFEAPGSVTINSVTIRRANNPLSLGFDEDNWNLPALEPGNGRVLHEAGSLFLSWSDGRPAITTFRKSMDLGFWFGPTETFHIPGHGPPGYDLSDDRRWFPSLYYRGTTCYYARWWPVERPLPGAVIQINFLSPDTGNTKIGFWFNGDGAAGSWAYLDAYGNPSGGGAFVVDSFEPEGPFRSRLVLDGDGLPDYHLVLHYDTDPSITFLYSLCRVTVQEVEYRNFGGYIIPVVVASHDGKWTYTPAP